jgi:hypothetical protein
LVDDGGLLSQGEKKKTMAFVAAWQAAAVVATTKCHVIMAKEVSRHQVQAQKLDLCFTLLSGHVNRET